MALVVRLKRTESRCRLTPSATALIKASSSSEVQDGCDMTVRENGRTGPRVAASAAGEAKELLSLAFATRYVFFQFF